MPRESEFCCLPWGYHHICQVLSILISSKCKLSCRGPGQEMERGVFSVGFFTEIPPFFFSWVPWRCCWFEIAARTDVHSSAGPCHWCHGTLGAVQSCLMACCLKLRLFSLVSFSTGLEWLSFGRWLLIGHLWAKQVLGCNSSKDSACQKHRAGGGKWDWEKQHKSQLS